MHLFSRVLFIYKDGQAVAVRLSKQVNKATGEVKKLVDLYNQQETAGSFPETISFTDALDCCNPLYFTVLCKQEVKFKLFFL